MTIAPSASLLAHGCVLLALSTAVGCAGGDVGDPKTASDAASASTEPSAPSTTTQTASVEADEASGSRAEGDKPSIDPAKLEALSKMCTRKGCIDGLEIEIVPSQGLPRGRYTIELEADDKRGRCELELPLPACERAPAHRCTGDVAVLVSENGCALAESEHGFGPLTIQGAPKRVVVSVARDGKPAGRLELAPSYQRIEPNGPGCGPVCNHAKGRLELAP
jgi:hypothetical protein